MGSRCKVFCFLRNPLKKELLPPTRCTLRTLTDPAAVSGLGLARGSDARQQSRDARHLALRIVRVGGGCLCS